MGLDNFIETAMNKVLKNPIIEVLRDINFASILKQSNFKKRDIGVKPYMIILQFLYMFIINKKISSFMKQSNDSFKKDVYYRLLKNDKYNWRKLLLLTSVKLICKLHKLQKTTDTKVLIIDDTVEIKRGKFIEGSCKNLWSNKEHRTVKGLNIVSLNYSDCYTDMMLDFSINYNKNQIVNVDENYFHHKSNAYKRRVEGNDGKNILALHMIQRVLKLGIYADYLLVDSWYAKPNFINEVKQNGIARQPYPASLHFNYSKTVETSKAPNVVAVLEGTDLKDEYLVITAHMDHLGKRNDSVIYYGADDDGSGTVGVLEIAKAFAKAKANGKGPRRSIVFMTVSGEEKGLWGSEYYTNHPIFPLEKTTANLNIDMIGRSDASRKQGDSTNYVYVVGDDKISTDLKPISEAVNKKFLKMELDYKFNDPKDPNRIYFRSDHFNFASKGVPIIFYYDGMLGADYHKPTDTPDKINYELLKKRAQLVFYTAWEMANRNEMLKRDLKLEIPGRF